MTKKNQYFSSKKVFTKVRSQQKTHADDSIDKLNRSVTVILLIMAALFVSSKSFGAQIVCLDEGIKLTPVGMDYVHSVCLIQDVKVIENFFEDADWRHHSVNTNSYAWIPLITLGLAFLFYMPYLVWKQMVRKNNYQHVPIDISSVIEVLKSSPTYKPEDFNNSIVLVAEYLDKCFTLNNYIGIAHAGFVQSSDDIEYKSGARQPKSFRDRSKPFDKSRPKIKIYLPLIVRYMFIKFLYLGVSVGVLFLADIFFQFRRPYYTFGFDMYQKYTTNNSTLIESLGSNYWPTNILCAISTRGDFKFFAENQFHCSLPANVFNEKVFLILWCWFMVMIVFNVYSILKWTSKLIFRAVIIRNMLLWPYTPSGASNHHVKSFIYEYLSGEGFLVLMLIKSNTKDWYCRSLVKELWRLYMGEETGEESTPSFNAKGNGDFHDIQSTLAKPSRRDLLAANADLELDATPRKTKVDGNDLNNNTNYNDLIKMQNL